MNSRLLELRHYLVLLISGIVAVMLCLMIWVPHPDLTWHDQQRLGQISISTLFFLSILLFRSSRVMLANPTWLWPATGVLVIGAFSAYLAPNPLWAASEVALLVVSVGIGTFVFCLMSKFKDTADLVLGAFLRLMLAGMVLQFYVSFVSALAHADLYFHPWSLLNGFSNMRYEGQFLTIMVPLLGARLFLHEGTSVRYPRGLDMFLMVSLAGMVFVAGTRGTIAAWLVTAAISWGFKEGRVAATRMLLAMVAGFVLAWLVLHSISWVTGQVADYRFTNEQVFGLSAREVLWKDAWVRIFEFPWLGIGPMHFASLKNPVAAHPHQALLQIASEWGVPVFFLIMTVVTIWLAKVFGELRSSDGKAGSELKWALVFAVSSSIVQSMVDGVLVMPYPQLWLAITVGWCSARCLPRFQGESVRVPGWLPLLVLGGSNVLLIAVAVTSYPNLVGAGEYCGGGPRFWCSGRI